VNRVRLFEVWARQTFPVKNGLKEGDALSPLLFNFTSEYDFRKVEANQEGLKLHVTHQLLVFDVKLLGGEVMSRIEKNSSFVGH
jgi:hypothetical protein